MTGVGDWKHIKKGDCPHIAELAEETTSDKQSLPAAGKDACEVCGETEDLRICMTCEKVFCCESHNSHNTEHFRQTDHPFIKPHKSDYNWLWCYKCNGFLE
ncbi:UBP-type zinc finger domain-containing protein [Candidatus Microgenomates bacterium]|nr:UBP-type zinc finger domain-containing protein [Candidatus Microgenomates bacterium]